MTARKYIEGGSIRLMVAKETLSSKPRQKLPIIIVNLNGTIGYFDEQRHYNTRLSSIQLLIALSANFRVIGIVNDQTKNSTRKLTSLL